MLTVALVLAVIGALTIVLTACGAFDPRVSKPEPLPEKSGKPEPVAGMWPVCAVPSPDHRWTCDQPLGHTGWHHHDTVEWFGEAWKISTEVQSGKPVITMYGLSITGQLPGFTREYKDACSDWR